MREHIAHIFDCAPIHLRLGFLHIRIGKLSSKFTDLKQVHADGIHVILIFQKDIEILAKTGKATVSAAKAAIDHRDFVGKYQLTGGRKLSILEESLVPKLEDWYIIPDQVANICKHAQITTGKPMQMRNFLLRGPAGTGTEHAAPDRGGCQGGRVP